MEDDLQSARAAGLAEELEALRALTSQLRAENARLLRLLELTPKQAEPPGPAQTGFFEAPPGPVDRRSAPEVKVDFFAALFSARTDIYATRWENAHTGKSAFFTAPVPAETARRLGTALLREAMAMRGRMDLASYDRLFPSQDVLPSGGVGNLIAAPLHGKARQDGATVVP